MRALITGAEGFAGGHLIECLRQLAPSTEVHGTVFAPDSLPRLQQELRSAARVDLRDQAAVRDLLQEIQPDVIYHLAAQAFVPRSFEDPWETLENNIRSQLNLILAILELGLSPRLLVVSSAEVYGIVQPDELPITEDYPLKPTNPYSVSKVGQDLLGLQYHLSHHLPIVRVRAFNHIGPRQSERFVAPAFAMQIACIEAGLQEPVIRVGELSPRRDFTDVRDVVRAYWTAANQGQAGAVYNVCRGEAYSIQELLDLLLSMTSSKVTVEVDPARLRPVVQPVVTGSAEKLRQDTGWQPTISFEQSLHDVLEDCRERVAREQA